MEDSNIFAIDGSCTLVDHKWKAYDLMTSYEGIEIIMGHKLNLILIDSVIKTTGDEVPKSTWKI